MKNVIGIDLVVPVTVRNAFGEKKLITTGLKCKRCRNEFFVYRFGTYYREVAFCPYCGIQSVTELKRKKEKEEEE